MDFDASARRAPEKKQAESPDAERLAKLELERRRLLALAEARSRANRRQPAASDPDGQIEPGAAPSELERIRALRAAAQSQGASDTDRKRKLAEAMQLQLRARTRLETQAGGLRGQPVALTTSQSGGMSEVERLRSLRAQTSASQAPGGHSVAPGTTQEQAKRIPEGMVYNPETGGYVDTALAAERMGPAQGANASFLSGIPLIGEWLDEGMGKVDQALTGRNPEIATETMRQSREQFADAHPVASTGLEIAGGVAGFLPVAASGAGVVSAAGSPLGTAGRAIGLGAGAGAVDGIAAGAGRQAGNRIAGAVSGGAIGLGVGGIAGAAAPVVGAGARAVAQRMRKLDVRTIADEFGISVPAARSVRAALVNDDLATATQRLQQLGPDAMLADAGPSTEVMLDAASKTGGRALAVTREAVEGRARDVGARLPRMLDGILGKPQGTREAARGIAGRTAGQRQAAYDRAYGSKINYAGPGRKVENVLQRIPPRTLNAAIEEANDAMRVAGVTNRQIMAEIGEDGAVTLREMPNVQQLDEIKKALDSVGREAVDQFGRPTAQGARARRLAAELRNATAEAVPSYRVALRIGGDKIAEDQALDMGRRLLMRSTTVEDVHEVVGGGLSRDAATAAKQGLRQGIEETLGNVRRTLSDGETGAREAMQLVKDMSSRANREKLALILGEGDADRLLGELDRSAMALELRSMVARNSDTAIRQAVQGQVADEAAPGLLRRIVGRGGNPLDAAKELTESLVGIDPATMSERQRAIYAEIAEALTRTRGKEAERALSAVRRAMEGQPLRQAEIERISRVTTGAAYSLLHQGGQQVLRQ